MRRMGVVVVAVLAVGSGLVATPGVAGAAPPLVGFAPRVTYPVGPNAFEVAAGDLNGDDVPDLAVAHGGQGLLGSGVSVLLGVGDGTFSATTEVSTGDAGIALALGDLDGDAQLDLAVVYANEDKVAVHLGHGDGTFDPRLDVSVGDGPNTVALGDLDGDAVLDLVVTNGNDTSAVAVFLGDGDGTFGPRTAYATPFPTAVTLADLDGDSVLDMIALGDWERMYVRLGDGDGTFGARTDYATGFGPQQVAIGDLDGDSRLDAAVADVSDDTVSVLLGEGDGTFGPRAVIHLPLGTNPYGVALGDLNMDSILDLAVTATGQGQVAVLAGAGDGTFTSPTSFAAGSGPRRVTVVDLDGDGLSDLTLPNDSNTVSVLRNVGAPSVPAAPLLVTATAGNGEATVSWSAPADGGSPLTGYVITPYIGAVAQTTVAVGPATTTRTIIGLANGTTYTFTVAASNVVGTGAPSAPSNAVTLAPVAPSPPTIGVAIPGASRARVSWTPPASDGGAPIVGYVVTPYVGSVSQGPRYFVSTSTTQTVAGLVNGTSYRFRVRAWNAAGVSPFSKVSNAVVPALMAPDAPTIVPAAAAGDGTATVSWSAPASDGGSPIIGYVVTPYVGFVSQGPRYYVSTSTTQVVGGLVNGTTYRFRVRAWNALGVSGFSTVTEPVTPSG